MSRHTNKQQCGLLALPTEIRLKILQYSLASAYPIQVPYGIKWIGAINPGSVLPRRFPVWDKWPIHHRPTGQILQTCRQIHDEGVEFLYRDNSFTVTLLVGDELIRSECLDFLGLSSLHHAFGKYPSLKHVTKFMLDIVIDPALGGATFANKHPQPVQMAVQQIQDLCPPRLDHVRIDVRYGTHVSTSDKTKSILYEIGLLRADGATLVGIPGPFAQTLWKRITSHEPKVDLRDVFKEAATHSQNNGEWKCFGAFMRHRLLMLSAIIDWDVERLEKLRNAVDVLAPALSVVDFERLLRMLDLHPHDNLGDN